MGTLNGTITNLVGGPLPSYASVTLMPTIETAQVGGDIRVGGAQVTLAADGSFSINAKNGEYHLSIRIYNPPARQMVTITTPPFAILDTTDLAEVLGLALLTGPQTLVVKLDTDGQPYFVTDGSGDYGVHVDTDGQPYYASGAGEDVWFDVDGAPVVLTLT